MPGEFSNPDYINPGGAVGSGSAAIITATQATRLALLLENASGRLIKQTSDSSVWCLKPDGLPANLADWELLGYYTADAAKPVSTAQAAAITAAQAAAQAAAALDATTKADAAQAAAAMREGAVDHLALGDKWSEWEANRDPVSPLVQR